MNILIDSFNTKKGIKAAMTMIRQRGIKTAYLRIVTNNSTTIVKVSHDE